MSTPSAPPTQEYDDDLVRLLEALWGEGFMSPGGPDEVDRVLAGVDLAGLAVLDIGCGAGGADVHIARHHHPAGIIGIDVEPDLIRRARELAARHDVARLTDFRCVEPGTLPLGDAAVQVVFSKDSIIHIADKASLAAEIHRVLAPHGIFTASDWLAGYPDRPSPAMQAYVEAEGLDFGLASAEVYVEALESAGFTGIEVRDRNAWYRREARRERERLAGSLQASLAREVGRDFLEHEVEVWDKMIVALDEGQLRPTHLRARRRR